ncbi:MAG TPA: hypothetical protein PKE48_10965 [Anaerolineales bacterium]|nr:hypothetical protein [Anaerolineales bacterium]
MKTIIFAANKVLTVLAYNLLFLIGARYTILGLNKVQRSMVSLINSPMGTDVYSYFAGLYILIGLAGFYFIARYWHIKTTIQFLEGTFFDKESFYSFIGVLIYGIFGGVIFLSGITFDFAN